MGMMSLGLDLGEKVNVVVDGADESDALTGIENYLSGR
jgi:phosphotransferase system HPr-like phosphotransfer protein